MPYNGGAGTSIHNSHSTYSHPIIKGFSGRFRGVREGGIP